MFKGDVNFSQWYCFTWISTISLRGKWPWGGNAFWQYSKASSINNGYKELQNLLMLSGRVRVSLIRSSSLDAKFGTIPNNKGVITAVRNKFMQSAYLCRTPLKRLFLHSLLLTSFELYIITMFSFVSWRHAERDCPTLVWHQMTEGGKKFRNCQVLRGVVFEWLFSHIRFNIS